MNHVGQLRAVPDQDPDYLLRETRSGIAVPVHAPRSPAATYLAELSASSRKCVRGRLDVLADMLQPGTDGASYPWETVTYAETAQLRAALGDRYRWQTANTYLTALRGVLRATWMLGLSSTDTYTRAVAFRRG